MHKLLKTTQRSDWITISNSITTGNSIEKHEDGYVCMHHAPSEQLSRRGSLGVSIMLRPEAWEGVKAAGNNYDYYVKLCVLRKVKSNKINQAMDSAIVRSQTFLYK